MREFSDLEGQEKFSGIRSAKLDLGGSVKTHCVHDSHMVNASCGLRNSSKRNYY